MKELMIAGGLEFMVPITLLAVVVTVLILKNVFVLIRKKQMQTESSRIALRAILFVGSLCFAIGVLGQTMGIYQMLQYISGSAKEIRPQIIAGGLQISMIPTLYGLFVFIIASLFWFLFHSYYKQLGKADKNN